MSTTSPYLAAAAERVVVYDGATGTWLQTQDLHADDYGGEHYEGCPELLAVTRPDVVAALHTAYFEVGRRRRRDQHVRVAARHPRRVPDRRAGRGAERGQRPHRPRGRRRLRHAGPAPVRRRLDGPGHQVARRSGQITFAELRDGFEVQARGLLNGGVDLLLIETQFDLLSAPRRR